MFVSPCMPPPTPVWEAVPGFYGGGLLGVSTARFVQFDPTEGVRQNVASDRASLLWGAEAGWNSPCGVPIGVRLGYDFEQTWQTDGNQLKAFSNGGGKAGNFLFPTRYMARRHTVTFSPRFHITQADSFGEVFGGLHMEVEWAYTGSNTLGAPGEITRKLWVREEFVPYGAVVLVPWTVWVYSPFITALDGRDSQFNMASYSGSPRGLGPRISLGAGSHWGAPDGVSHVYAGWERRSERMGRIHLDRIRHGAVVAGYWGALPAIGVGIEGGWGYQETTFPVGWVVNTLSLDPRRELPKTPQWDTPRAITRYDGTHLWHVGVRWGDAQGQWQLKTQVQGWVTRSNLADSAFSNYRFLATAAYGFGFPQGPAGKPHFSNFKSLFPENSHHTLFGGFL